jgi:CheY-like chemotaxis protein
MVMNDDDTSAAGRVLIVNHDRDGSLAMGCVLWLNGYHPECIETIAEAGRRLGTRRYALLVCRNAMPDGDGSDLIRHAWADCGVPAVAVTQTLTREQMAARVACAGLRGVLVLPAATQKTLLLAVANALGRADVGPAYPGYIQARGPQPCPDCRGTGNVTLLVHRTTCSRCGGDGTIVSELMDLPIRCVDTIPALTRFALYRAGIRTLRDLKRVPREEFRQRLGLSETQMEDLREVLQ